MNTKPATHLCSKICMSVVCPSNKTETTTEQSHCKHFFTFVAVHSGKSVFILCGKHLILAITRQFISPQRGKNHSQKLPWPSFLKSKLTNFSLIACWRLLHGVQSWAETLSTYRNPLDAAGLSDCARSSVLWATSAHLSLPGLNDAPGTLQTVEIEFLTEHSAS